MKKVFIYVGHSNWGKSRALKVLTGNNVHQRTVQIDGFDVRVRKMSNDDDGEALLNWVKTFPRLHYQRFVIAFCPKVPPVIGDATPEQNMVTDILMELQSNNQLFFFVQLEKFNSSTQVITQQEINWLRTFGTVHILSGQNPDTTRASDFHNFISQNI